MKRIITSIFAAVLLLNLAGCASKEAEEQFIGMDTAIRLVAYGGNAEKAVEQGMNCVMELERTLSRTLEDSDVAAFNAGERTDVAAETAWLLKTAAEYTRTTNGAFDITIAPVVASWGFTTDSYQVPEQAELEALLKTVDGTALRVEPRGDGRYDVITEEGQVIDLGGIAKGYASDRMADIFAEQKSSGGLAALGGNVLAWGTKPDDRQWQVAVQDPEKPNDGGAWVGVLPLEDAFAVTSGGYQRFFEENGQTYHHIIDPATGYPADSGLTSVTVVADCHKESLEGKPGNGTMCDALSTALFVMGEEKALEFWHDSGLDFDLVLVTEDGQVLVTDGLTDGFIFNEESGYQYEIVS